VLDEIPTPQKPGENQAGLTFQMRYSVPLFVYGNGLTPDGVKQQLSWQLVNDGGKRFIEIANRGNGHARISKAQLDGRTLSDGLLGYVLARSSNRFPVNAASGSELQAQVNDSSWRSRGSR